MLSAVENVVTLILTVNSPDTIWMLADRRLSYSGTLPKDDARKIMFLDTTDGHAILGYAGLGATAHGTEPADWMSAVLRGRNVPLEQSLGIVANTMKGQFPRHMRDDIPAHVVLASAFLNEEARLYTIDLVFEPSSMSYRLRCGRQVVGNSTRPPRVAIAGTGAPYLARNKKKWIRTLLRVVIACDRQEVSDWAVADYLASLNYEVHQNVTSVGPRCFVVWLHRKGGVRGGGAQQCYSRTVRDASSPILPAILCGGDITAVMEVMMPRWTEVFQQALRTGESLKELDHDEINAALARIPTTPDENLR
jgi:hypothetical protein